MKNILRPLISLIIISFVSFWAGCASISDVSEKKMGLANPAAVNCIKKGGQLNIEKDGAGSEYGLCLFGNNRQCEEWALLRGRCPVGGVTVTGYLTDAAKYCVVRGGKYSVTSKQSLANLEEGTCAIKGGRVCNAQQWFSGGC